MVRRGLPDADDRRRRAAGRVPTGARSKSVKNWLHVDLEVDDLDRAFAKIAALGGSAISDVLQMPGGYRWRVMADPEGNEFCIVPRDED